MAQKREDFIRSILITTYRTKAQIEKIEVIPEQKEYFEGYNMRFTFCLTFAKMNTIEKHKLYYSTDIINVIQERQILCEENLFMKEISQILRYKKTRDYCGYCSKCGKAIITRSTKVKKDELCNECLGINKKQKVYIEVVYLMESKMTGLWKIGTSKNVKKRRRQLELAQGCEIELLKAIPGGVVLERLLHEKFSEYRTIGEWFTPVNEIKDTFNSISEGNTNG